MIKLSDALQSLCPGAEWILRGNEYAGLEWLDKVQPKPSEIDVATEMARLNYEAPFKVCKAKAKELIALTDWSQYKDVQLTLQNGAEFEAYRATLRAYIINPVANPVWPDEPQPIWL